jgi:hypothetical protein
MINSSFFKAPLEGIGVSIYLHFLRGCMRVQLAHPNLDIPFSVMDHGLAGWGPPKLHALAVNEYLKTYSQVDSNAINFIPFG